MCVGGSAARLVACISGTCTVYNRSLLAADVRDQPDRGIATGSYAPHLLNITVLFTGHVFLNFVPKPPCRITGDLWEQTGVFWDGLSRPKTSW